MTQDGLLWLWGACGFITGLCVGFTGAAMMLMR